MNTQAISHVRRDGLLNWKGQKEGSFSSYCLEYIVILRFTWTELNLTKHCAGFADVGHWCICQYTYLWPNFSLSLFLFPLSLVPLAVIDCFCL